MVGITVRQCLRDGFPQTGHVGTGVPEPGRQILVRIERIALGVVWHLRPVNAAHILAPAEDLTNETLGAWQRHLPGATSCLGRLHDLARIQQLQIKRSRKVRVVQPGLTRPECILVASKQRQALVNEALQGL